jgi:hypothetical protein
MEKRNVLKWIAGILIGLLALCFALNMASCTKETIKQIAGPTEYDTIVGPVVYDTLIVVDTLYNTDTLITSGLAYSMLSYYLDPLIQDYAESNYGSFDEWYGHFSGYNEITFVESDDTYKFSGSCTPIFAQGGEYWVLWLDFYEMSIKYNGYGDVLDPDNWTFTDPTLSKVKIGDNSRLFSRGIHQLK